MCDSGTAVTCCWDQVMWPLIILQLSVTTVNFSQSCLQTKSDPNLCVAIFAVKSYHYQLIWNLSIHQNHPKYKTGISVYWSSDANCLCFSFRPAPRPLVRTYQCQGPTCPPSAVRSHPRCHHPCHPASTPALCLTRLVPDYPPLYQMVLTTVPCHSSLVLTHPTWQLCQLVTPG